MLTAVIFIIAGTAYGQPVTYKHPDAEIEFQATPDWEQQMRSDNSGVFELTHPNHNMQISLSFIPECRNPKKELRKLSGLKGLVTGRRPSDTVLNNKKAFLMKGMCLQGQLPYVRMVVGIPADGGLYLMDICCPEDCYLTHQELVRSVLSTLTVGVHHSYS